MDLTTAELQNDIFEFDLDGDGFFFELASHFKSGDWLYKNKKPREQDGIPRAKEKKNKVFIRLSPAA
ncbi:MAG: hypothetical protein DWQ05_22810 [Calditrichaeota bacterium]|nr:MAG: hypothetical protein DWQ05_22810 [Calditrichota bacterium]